MNLEVDMNSDVWGKTIEKVNNYVVQVPWCHTEEAVWKASRTLVQK